MKKLILSIIACVAVLCLYAQTKSFPTAEGFGSMAQGGRGGEVVEVTTLEDAATNPPVGSLRWAVTQHAGKPITIVFRVSGLISLKADLRMKRDYVTIAGQTAPGDGICIMDAKVNFGGSRHLVIRHLRFRVGTMNGDPAGKGSIGIENASDWIIDHCTFGWSGEENMTIYDNMRTTIQWSIIHEGLYQSGHDKGNRGYGMQWGGQNVTFHHNLIANNHNRTPRFNGARSNDHNVLIDYVNNVNYNWGKANSSYGSDIERTSNRTNFVNNYYKPGPARPGTSSSYFTQSTVASSQGTKVAQWHMSGNYMEGTANASRNTNNYAGLDMGSYSSSIRNDSSLYISREPFAITHPVVAETAHEAYISVLAGAGAFPRDTVDRRIINETRTGTATGSGAFGTNKGIIDNPEAVGGYPEYNTYNTITDNDKDGMDDAWELANGLDPNNPNDRNLRIDSATGYTVLEAYLNFLVGEIIPFDINNLTSVKNNPTANYDIIFGVENNQLTVSCAQSPVTNMRIYNVIGQIQTETTNSNSLNISTLSSGIYFAEAITADKTRKVLKFKK